MDTSSVNDRPHNACRVCGGLLDAEEAVTDVGDFFESEDVCKNLACQRVASRQRYEAKLSALFEKYGQDTSEYADEIDLATGAIVVDHGHLRGLHPHTPTDELVESVEEPVEAAQSGSRCPTEEVEQVSMGGSLTYPTDPPQDDPIVDNPTSSPPVSPAAGTPTRTSPISTTKTPSPLSPLSPVSDPPYPILESPAQPTQTASIFPSTPTPAAPPPHTPSSRTRSSLRSPPPHLLLPLTFPPLAANPFALGVYVKRKSQNKVPPLDSTCPTTLHIHLYQEHLPLPDMDASISASSKFLNRYYAAQDSGREKLLEFYFPESRITWNGQPVSREDLTKLLQPVPASSTRIDDFDCQFVGTDDSTIAVTVSGSVKYAGQNARGFSDNFLLQRNGDAYCVVSQNFRIVTD
ncbi:mRNA export receptor Nxt1 [Schizosaccharomyces japonicus yFS275]|uniref:mRNA export receptor Nxt1 n=1 Tax=Schizosaccharomyces japonicus (strain yFS275 / FY16936) TaxID=402676 RepID=B6K7K7_SCHJY|nr:mRNA export receptor Nxt1 [Schizosaccharomyces japonicus yFS275]EEB09511.1 mRNA export receptor Nxt1 [Schizosaccharomyces japonicus yFS275]